MVFRFIKCCKGIKTNEYEVTQEETALAEEKLLRKTLPIEEKFQKTAESLGIYKDNRGFLRCRGRIQRAKLPFETIHPLIIPKEHYLTE